MGAFFAPFLPRKTSQTRSKSTFLKGDVLYGKLRPYLNKVVVADDDGICTTEIVPIVLFGKVDPHFLRWALKRPAFLDYVNTLMYGVKMPRLGTEQAVESIHPLPPIAEQRRIVAKIDELMARCDELEKLRQVYAQKQITVHTAALNQLLTAKDHNDFKTSWHFITQHFSELYSVKANVTELRKAILQLAVMGKLVPQDPNDQPASELLKKIEVEYENLSKADKIKDLQKSPKIKEEEKLFEIPKSWVWTRSENAAQFIDPQPSHRTPPEYADGIPYVGYSDIDHEKGINFLSARKVNPKVFEEHCQRYQLKLGDFVFGKIGTLGQPFFLPEPFNYCLSANLILIQPNLLVINPKYLAIFLDSPSFATFLDRTKTNSTHGVFGIKKARLICLPLPPLAEQHRIVAKIDQLMTLCDELEKQIDIANSKKTNLLNSVMTKI